MYVYQHDLAVNNPEGDNTLSVSRAEKQDPRPRKKNKIKISDII